MTFLAILRRSIRFSVNGIFATTKPFQHSTTDKSTCAILEQIEFLARRIEETQRIADSGNKKRAAEIELLGKHICKINLGHDATTELGSFITMDESNTSNDQKKRPPVKPNETDDMDSEEEAVSSDNSTYNAKTCLDLIPIFNVQDDIGVEGFIKRIREARAKC